MANAPVPKAGKTPPRQGQTRREVGTQSHGSGRSGLIAGLPKGGDAPARDRVMYRIWRISIYRIWRISYNGGSRGPGHSPVLISTVGRMRLLLGAPVPGGSARLCTSSARSSQG